MSYEKITLEIPQIADALACVGEACGATGDTQAAMLGSGITVLLDNGLRAWVACVVQDNPETYSTEILTVAIAVDADGAIRTRSGNVPIHRAYWHGADPVTLASRGLDAVRRDLMRMALGEEPDDADEPADVQALHRRYATERSIRVAVEIADAVIATPSDVL